MSEQPTTPPGWEPTTLGSLGRYLNGRGFRKNEWSKQGRPIIRIQNLTGSSEKVNYYDGEVDPAHIAKPGDLLMSWAATLDAFIWPGPEGCVNQHIFKVESFIDKKFHYYLLRNVLDDLRRKTHGSGMVHITRSKFDETPAAVPPPDEQHRIVAKIEELFSDLDAGVAALTRVRANLKRYRASVLKTAVEGRLTAAWRQAHPGAEPADKLLARILAERRTKWEEEQLRKYAEKGTEPPKGWKDKYRPPLTADMSACHWLPPGWTWATVDACAYDVTVGHVGSMKDRYEQDGIPFLRSQNVRPLRFDPLGLKYIPEDFHAELAKSRLIGGELLVVRSGNVGEACVYPEEAGEANCADLVITRLLPSVLAHYMAAFVASPTGERSVLGKRTGSALPHFNVGAMERSAVPLPPPAEQAEIVGEVDRRLSVVAAVDTEIEHALQRAGRLRQAILKRAFEGRLLEHPHVPLAIADQPTPRRVAARVADPACSHGGL